MDLRDKTLGLLKEHKLHPRDYLGQNFLLDSTVIQREVEEARVSNKDTVMEVGPGTGFLTEALAEKAGKVIAVEKDVNMVSILEDRFQDRENVQIVHGDIMKIDLPDFNKCVSNIPYMISSPFTFRLLEADLDMAVITYQKEFAQRMAARTGERAYSRLSVGCYYSFNVELLQDIPPTSFYPPPKVASTMVRLTPKDPPFKVDRDLYFRLVKGLFVHRQKTVRNALFHSFGMVFKGDLKKAERRAVLDSLSSGILDQKVFKTSPDEMAVLSSDIQELDI